MTDQEIENMKNHSTMLGQIASEVSEFCDNEECTTLDAVRILKIKYLKLLVRTSEDELNNMIKKLDQRKITHFIQT